MIAQKNLPLIFAISIPIILIFLVFLSIYLPQFFVKPNYNFLYVTGNNYCYSYGKGAAQIFLVKNNTIVRSVEEQAISSCTNTDAQQVGLYVYDTSTNQAKEISFNDASKLFVVSSSQSPDGFNIINGSGGGGFFPFYFSSSSDYNSKYISGHNLNKKLNILTEGNNYHNFTFLGWVSK